MSTRRPHRVLIHVQHLLGAGHLQRALALAEAFARRGLRVDIASGGKAAVTPPSPGIGFHQLPPAYSADGSFSRILDDSGKPIDETWKARRREQLLALFDTIAPRALVTETFPFGRRMLSFELIPLLEQARKRRERICVIASIRDILQPKSKPGREQEILQRIDAYYDHVLVHGDARIADLETSFGAAAQIAGKLFYSGYVCAGPAAPAGAAADEVLVSAGSSDTGYAILETALAAKPLSRLAASRWRILVSPAIDQNRYRRLRSASCDDVIVERNRSDFSALMGRARLSVSQAGYNTITDILQAGAPAVVIPFADAGEREQTLRAEAFRARRRVVMLEHKNLNPASLASAIDAAADLDTGLEVDLDGADSSAAKIESWLGDLVS